MRIKIHGEIIDAESKEYKLMFFGKAAEQDVSYKDLDDALSSKQEDDREIHLDINCQGGSCVEGFAMYDRLRSLQGHTITAEVVGECSSMATILLMAASRRIGHPNSRYCIHKPRFADFYLQVMTEEEAKRAYEDLHAETERLKKIYLDRTAFNEHDLEALMHQDRYMTAEEALHYGVLTEIAQPMTAIKTNKFKHRPMKLTAAQKIALRAVGLGEGIGILEAAQQAVSMTLNTEDGASIEIEREEGEPQVGDKVLGDTPDGEYVMADGTTIVIAEGVITEIRPAEEQTEEEKMSEEEMIDAIASMTEQIEALTAENEELKSQLSASKSNEKSAEDARILEMVSNAGGVKWLESLQTTFKPQSRKVEVSKTPAPTEREQMLAEARNKYKNRK